MKSLWEEYPLRSAMTSKNLLKIKAKKKTWIEHIFCDMGVLSGLYTINISLNVQ